MPLVCLTSSIIFFNNTSNVFKTLLNNLKPKILSMVHGEMDLKWFLLVWLTPLLIVSNYWLFCKTPTWGFHHSNKCYHFLRTWKKLEARLMCWFAWGDQNLTCILGILKYQKILILPKSWLFPSMWPLINYIITIVKFFAKLALLSITFSLWLWFSLIMIETLYMMSLFLLFISRAFS